MHPLEITRHEAAKKLKLLHEVVQEKSKRSTMKAKGWVIATPEEILVKTVQDSRVGAIVNYLITYAKHPVYAHMTDAQVENLFKPYTQQYGVYVVEVTITN